MDEWREQAFHGGRQTVGITRIGDTVRRPRHARSDLVHAVLRHLEAAGFDGAPRLLGIDEHGREVLTYIDGKTIDSSPVSLSDGAAGERGSAHSSLPRHHRRHRARADGAARAEPNQRAELSLSSCR